jgi:hypothetical protein
MHRNRTRITAALAAAAAAGVLLAGCSDSAGHRMNAPVTLTCHYVWPFSITTTDTIGTEVGTLAADDRAIGGNWTAAQTGVETSAGIGPMTGPGADASQQQAITDLDDFITTSVSLPVQSQGRLSDELDALGTDAGTLTDNQGLHPDGLGAGPAVHRDIRALAAMCGAS